MDAVAEKHEPQTPPSAQPVEPREQDRLDADAERLSLQVEGRDLTFVRRKGVEGLQAAGFTVTVLETADTDQATQPEGRAVGEMRLAKCWANIEGVEFLQVKGAAFELQPGDGLVHDSGREAELDAPLLLITKPAPSSEEGRDQRLVIGYLDPDTGEAHPLSALSAELPLREAITAQWSEQGIHAPLVTVDEINPPISEQERKADTPVNDNSPKQTSLKPEVKQQRASLLDRVAEELNKLNIAYENLAEEPIRHLTACHLLLQRHDFGSMLMLAERGAKLVGCLNDSMKTLTQSGALQANGLGEAVERLASYTKDADPHRNKKGPSKADQNRRNGDGRDEYVVGEENVDTRPVMSSWISNGETVDPSAPVVPSDRKKTFADEQKAQAARDKELGRTGVVPGIAPVGENHQA